jgi:hypothetical protein
MATILPVRIAPAFNQPGQTAQRYGGAFFNPSSTFPELAGQIPKNIGATTLDLSPINVAGFNTFMCLLDVTVANIQFAINIIDPTNQTTVLFTRNIGAAIVAGTGLNVLNFGFGNTAALAGADVFYFMSLRFIGSGANATINQFPGLWGCVR